MQASPHAAPPPDPGASLAPGRVLGAYSLVRLIGAGAAGAVWAAKAPGGEWVALKVLVAAPAVDQHDADEQRQRFLQEAEAGRRLAHPDIVTILDAGQTDGRWWTAMALARGVSLERYTHPARLLPEPVVLDIGIRIARALAHAHAHGVIHRDVKPSNVIVDVTAGCVSLTDFGTAWLIDQTRTRTGVILGTPAYMAPEQLAGAPADARSDLYSLGVVVYELLCGRRPHESGSMGELLRQVASVPAPDIRSLRPTLPAALAEALAQVLAKRPAQRPPDGEAFAEALGRARLHTAGGVGGP